MGTRYFSIGELAGAVGVPTSTLRYYERAGILRPAGRTGANYRFYDESSLERLRFIRAAQTSGFTLDDVQALLALRSGETAPCTEVQQLVESRLAGVEERLRDLRSVRSVLKDSLRMCREREASGECHVLETLDRSARTDP